MYIHYATVTSAKLAIAINKGAGQTVCLRMLVNAFYVVRLCTIMLLSCIVQTVYICRVSLIARNEEKKYPPT